MYFHFFLQFLKNLSQRISSYLKFPRFSADFGNLSLRHKIVDTTSISRAWISPKVWIQVQPPSTSMSLRNSTFRINSISIKLNHFEFCKLLFRSVNLPSFRLAALSLPGLRLCTQAVHSHLQAPRSGRGALRRGPERGLFNLISPNFIQFYLIFFNFFKILNMFHP